MWNNFWINIIPEQSGNFWEYILLNNKYFRLIKWQIFFDMHFEILRIVILITSYVFVKACDSDTMILYASFVLASNCNRKYMLSCLYLALLQGIILGIIGEEKNW